MLLKSNYNIALNIVRLILIILIHLYNFNQALQD